MSTSGLSASAWPTRSPGPRTRLTTPGRQPGLLEQSGEVDGRQRRELGRLHDRGVAGRQGRRDLPAHLQERVVPGPDQAADPDRLVDDPAEGVRVARVDEAARLLVGEIRVIAEDPGDVGHVPAALAHRLAGVERLQASHLLEVAIDQLGDRVQDGGPLAGRRARPVGRIEGAPGCGNRRLDLAVRRHIDLADDGPIRRVHDRAALAAGGGDPLAVDVEAGHGSLALPSRSRRWSRPRVKASRVARRHRRRRPVRGSSAPGHGDRTRAVKPGRWRAFAIPTRIPHAPARPEGSDGLRRTTPA